MILKRKYEMFDELTNSKLVIYSVYLMLLSYFYNLPVLKYSIKGDNEFRLFDLVGVSLFYLYIKNYHGITALIKREKTFLYLHYFLQWTTFTWIFTLIFSFVIGKYTWALQSFLYLYHFWAFYLTIIFLVIVIQDLNQLKKLVSLLLIFSIITFLIVILQNLNLIPFLWNDEYLKAYNFLSGTLGPNKIVLGMTCFFTFSLCMGLLNEKQVKINRTLLITATCIALITLIISGSRTSYVALLVFGIVFLVLKTKSFIYSSITLFFMVMLVSVVNTDVIDMAVGVFQNRVENKIQNPNDIKDGNVDELYEDLGSGRKGLSVLYIEYLIDNPLYVPFGIGFNNRLMIGSSAHNMYLSLINEVGLVGFFLYFRWLLYYLFVKIKHFSHLKTSSVGLILAMIVTLFFGEHLYVYRPLFGTLGLFLFIITILLSPHYILKQELNEK